jgi:hypothetical protein
VAGKEWRAFQKGTADNPTIPGLAEELAAFKAECLRNGTMWMYEQEALGIPADDGSNPIGLAAIARAESDRSREPVAAVGIDLAQSVDYTVIYAVDRFGRWTHCERWQAPWTLTKRRIAAWLDAHVMRDGVLDVPVCVDQSGVGSPVVGDLHVLGYAVRGVTFGDSSRRSMLERLVVDVQGGRVSIPSRVDPASGFVVSELESLGTEQLPSGKVRYAVPSGMHDDGVMALALCCEAFKGAALPSFERVMPRNERDNRSTTSWREKGASRAAVTTGPMYATVRWDDEGESVDF